MKKFNYWNNLKHKLEINSDSKYFKERDIWWCHTGSNNGHEEDGKGINLARPILIIKKHNKNCFLGLSLSSKNKNNKYYFGFKSKNITFYAILSQIKLFSSKRLMKKICKIDKITFIQTKKLIAQINLGD